MKVNEVSRSYLQIPSEVWQKKAIRQLVAATER